MRNGHYLIRHNLLGNKYTLKVSNGVHSLYVGPAHVRNVSAEGIKKFYDILETLPGKPSEYDIAWWVDGKIKEVIKVGASYCICKWKIKQMENSTHRHGLLRPIKKP